MAQRVARGSSLWQFAPACGGHRTCQGQRGQGQAGGFRHVVASRRVAEAGLLDAIAAVVIGGTLLSGGVGYVFGTLFGVLTLGMIQSLIMFDGSLSSWWTRIVIGALLFVFCVLQRLFETGRKPV